MCKYSESSFKFSGFARTISTIIACV